ncbi:MAG: hypothetical protein GEU75_02940 [Dehalococcoidia bacterium]|nr:hypothetical protein [Dehalococcoidia bacterium]
MTNAEDLDGGLWIIAAIVRNGVCLARAYMDGNELTDIDRKRLWALISRTAQVGPPFNDEKFKKVEGPIFEFKSYQDRLLCFFDGERRIVITHGCKKKTNRARKEEITRALTLRAEYFA